MVMMGKNIHGLSNYWHTMGKNIYMPFHYFLIAFSCLYHRRHYRIKFAQKVDYQKWQILFSTNSMLPFCQKPSVTEGGNASIANAAATGGFNSALNGLLGSTATSTTTKVDEILNPEHTLTAFAADISYDNEAAKKYARLLRAGEKVLAAGTILKFEKTMSSSSASNAPKQRRILLVTDLPRMIFIDTIGSIVRGNLELSSDTKVDVRSVSDSSILQLNMN
jgi:hypothetical protein